MEKRSVTIASGIEAGWRIAGLSLALVVAPHVSTAAAAQDSQQAPSSASAVLQRYCVSCHSDRLKTAGLSLQSLDSARPAPNAEIWEKVVRKLRAGTMPPVGVARPDSKTYQSVASQIEASIDEAAKASPDPGRPLVHRLNRVEYRNAVRDLLGLELDDALLPPADSSSHGFDNIADVLTFSPGLMERYLLIAQQISAVALGNGVLKSAKHTYDFPFGYVQEDRPSTSVPVGSRGIAVRHLFPADGEYIIRIRLQKKRGGSGALRGMREAQDVDVRLDGEHVTKFPIGGNATDRESPLTYAYRALLEKQMVLRVPVKTGTREVAVLFRQQHRAAEGIGPSRLPTMSGSFTEGLNTDAQYGRIEAGVDSIDIEGPFNERVEQENPHRQRLIACPERVARDERRCASTILSTLARRSYRRPTTEVDLQLLMKFFEEGRAGGDFATGIQRALELVLTHPEFLVRVERDPKGARPGDVYKISDIDLASRLSFFLWSSIPDDELLDLAARGQLRKTGVLRAQVARMLRDKRSEAFITNFFGQWLGARNLQAMAPDPKVYPEFDENLREAFRTETALFLQAQVREDRSALELLTADYTYVNERLARYYGIPNIYGGQFRRVTLPGEDRRGILGHGSLLTVTSYANRTSPVGRGKWLLTNIMGVPPPPPPPDVPPFPESSGAQPTSVRARMEQHRKNPVCASCHNTLDPLGFAFENFDGIGGWRTTEAGTRVDASGMLPDGNKFARPNEFRKALVSGYGELYITTIVERLLMYAVGREVQYPDMPVVRAITANAARDNYRWTSLIVDVVSSAPFQMRKAS